MPRVDWTNVIASAVLGTVLSLSATKMLDRAFDNPQEAAAQTAWYDVGSGYAPQTALYDIGSECMSPPQVAP